MKLQYIWHSFFKINMSGVNILVDPFLNVPVSDGSFAPLVKCSVTAESLKNISLILISNEHFDHFDKELIELVAKKNNAVVVGHESVLNELNISPGMKANVQVGRTLNLRGIAIEVRGAHYPSSFYPVSFLISDGKESVFFAGNSALMDSFSTVKADVALLPIGGGSTMDVVDAVRATKTMKPVYAIPMHYNSFESICADPNDFKSRIDKSILKTKPVILKPGQSFKT